MAQPPRPRRRSPVSETGSSGSRRACGEATLCVRQLGDVVRAREALAGNDPDRPGEPIGREFQHSLRLKVGIAVAVSLGVLSAGLAGFLDWRTGAMLQSRAERNARVAAEQLALGLRAAVEFGDATGAAEVLSTIRAEPDAIYAVVARDGLELARWTRPGVDPSTPAAAEVVSPVLSGADSRGARHPIAQVRLGLDDGELRQTRAQSFRVFGVATLVVVLLGLALGMALGGYLVTPLLRLAAATAEVAHTGDISRDFQVASRDEVGVLARAFNGLVGSLRGMVSTQRDAAGGLGHVVGQLSAAGSAATGSAERIRAQMEVAGGATDALERAGAVLADSIAVLRRGAGAGRASIDDIDRANRAAVGQINSMVTSTERTMVGLQAIAASAGETARSIERVDEALEQATSAVGEMRATVENIEKGSRATADLANDAALAARSGADTLEQSRRSMEEIGAGFATTSGSLIELQRRVEHIGDVLGIIADVADKTSLLALNASIIAAQAGEQGRGFNVVAEEIKLLADRTRRATTESVEIVRGIEEHTHAAETRMRDSATRVQAGMVISRKVAEAFDRILTSSERSSQMVGGIARATEEHARGARSVSETMVTVTADMRSLREASGAQVSRADAMSQATAEVSRLAAGVLAAGRAQTAGSGQLTELMTRITETVTTVTDAHVAQADAVTEVVRATNETRRSGEAQSAALLALERSIESLREQAARLQGAFGKFRADQEVPPDR